MNCKQGDLALVIAGPSMGMAVTCLEPLPAGWHRDDLPRGCGQRVSPQAGPLWRVDRAIEWGQTPEGRNLGLPTHMNVVPDRALMPIRPEPDDEARTAAVPVAAKQLTVEGC